MCTRLELGRIFSWSKIYSEHRECLGQCVLSCYLSLRQRRAFKDRKPKTIKGKTLTQYIFILWQMFANYRLEKYMHWN